MLHLDKNTIRFWFQDLDSNNKGMDPNKNLTSCISNSRNVTETNAEDHQFPVEIWKVDLALYLPRCMFNFNSRKTTKCLTLVYDGESGSLAPHSR